MNVRLRNRLACCTICALLVTAPAKPAMANSLPTHSDIVWIGVGVAAIGAAIGVGVYLAVRPHGRSVTGCANSGAGGLQLVNESDQQTYMLVGDVTGLKSGERVRALGKKQKQAVGVPRQFLVEKLAKDYGACTERPATP